MTSQVSSPRYTRTKDIFPVIVLMAVWAQARAEDLPGMGPWRLGMTASQVAAFDELGPYSKVGVTGGLETPNGTFNGRGQARVGPIARKVKIAEFRRRYGPFGVFLRRRRESRAALPHDLPRRQFTR